VKLSDFQLPVRYENAREFAVVLDESDAADVCLASSGSVEPRAMSDGRFFMPGDILSEVGAGGIHELWFLSLDTDRVKDWTVMPSADAVALLPCPRAIGDQCPENVSARQIRLWLVTNGISLATVDATIDSIADAATRDTVRVEWDYAPYIERSHRFLVPLAAALGLDEAGVDQAFREAATL
jgi:hypothetical protein